MVLAWPDPPHYCLRLANDIALKYLFLQKNTRYSWDIGMYSIENLQELTELIPNNLCMDKNYICISSSVSKDDMKMKFVHTYIRPCFGDAISRI